MTWIASYNGILAFVNTRGGGEYGDDWHNQGIKTKKQNVFDDFIAAAEFLINDKITSKDYLAISGGSNGGLLVGAVITQRPELFRAAKSAVPLLDMLRYHLFQIARIWIPEFGFERRRVFADVLPIDASEPRVCLERRQ